MSRPPSAPTAAHRRFALLVPVKPPARGKSRLLGLPDDVRRDLAAAFALDTVAAGMASAYVGAVLVATDDAAFSVRFATLGCPAIPDGVTGDLNASLRQAAAEARRRWPDLQPVALCADLPALRSADLDAALAQVGEEPAYVPDAAGTGTTLYTAEWDRFEPRFGPGSRDAHDERAFAVGLDATTLRCDVDDLDDLRTAVALGVGPRTRALAADL
ncbi:MAG TPA: 2-phospho-L-lactate guanylyltransferase [Nocardioides sp.]|uniref:2-phospho-L-lactate guanylyltransferase n=1 Tax=Nocardioides sp. TaxID=35761 RepID=UPI002C66B668|nr:2-phospho-L-lactate guanylyltransferase [Nocardioides sp.]HTW17928.1 2-phospho-L-lactate guanylyltransferase [Nocardioides sp.]